MDPLSSSATSEPARPTEPPAAPAARPPAPAGPRESTLGHDDVFAVRTSDDWTLRVFEYLPAPGSAPRAQPVLLCHGLAMNARTFDLAPGWSLARHLARRGFHVLVPELRGRGRSVPAEGCSRRLHDYSFDDHALVDAPALLKAVLERSGARRAVWAGHSMGGVVGYVVAAMMPDAVSGLVTFASPVRLAPDPVFLRAARAAVALPMDCVPQRALATLLAPVASAFPFARQVSSTLVDMDVHLLRAALASLVEDLPRRLIRQMLGWMRSGHYGSEDGRLDYVGLLPRVTAPLLCLSACGDRIAPPETVRPGLDLVSSADRTGRCLGDDLGQAGRPYGHGDLLLGRDAPAVVYPVVARWLEERVPVALEAAQALGAGALGAGGPGAPSARGPPRAEELP